MWFLFYLLEMPAEGPTPGWFGKIVIAGVAAGVVVRWALGYGF